MSNPIDLRYTAEHEWTALDGDTARVGITPFAADALGEVVHLELPAVGATITAGEPCGELESTKSVTDLYAPVTGEVVAVNARLGDDPGLVNTDAFGEGWLFDVRITAVGELLDASAYDALTEA